MFIIPTNSVTHTLDYDIRFMLSDNPIHPTTFAISKMNTLTPIGISKIVLKQDHYNKNLDNVDLKICDYFTPVKSIPEEILAKKVSLTLNGTEPLLYINGNHRILTANYSGEEDYSVDWSFKLAGENMTYEEFENYFEAEDLGNKLSIRAKKQYSLIGKILTITAAFYFENHNPVRVHQDLEVVR